MASCLVLLLLVKKLTVIGIIEYTHGVSTASRPPINAAKKRPRNDLGCLSAAVVSADICATAFLTESVDACAAAIAVFCVVSGTAATAGATGVVSFTASPPASFTIMVNDLVDGGRHISSVHIW